MDIKIYNLLKNAHNGPVLSKFLTIDEQSNLVSSDLEIIFSNSYDSEERKRALIYPKGLDINPEFKISFLKLISKDKLKHPEVLGALMSLGISREVIGDIIISEDIYIIICSEIEKYIIDNLLTINKSTVEVKKVTSLNDIITSNYVSSSIIIPSLRLDSVLSKSINLSREKAQDIIKQRYVRINGTVCLENDYICKQDDIISVTKVGRIIVRDISRKTKKDKIVLNIERTK